MWSFIASVIVFLVLISGFGFWQRITRRQTKSNAPIVDQQIQSVAEVAQRRHKQRFGRESTGIMEILNPDPGTGPHSKS
jgi:uncharacterized protein YneF (UPF0154 family)